MWRWHIIKAAVLSLDFVNPFLITPCIYCDGIHYPRVDVLNFIEADRDFCHHLVPLGGKYFHPKKDVALLFVIRPSRFGPIRSQAVLNRP